MQLGPILAEEGHAGQHIVLDGVRQVCQLGPARGQLFGDLAPDIPGMDAVGLVESLPDRGGDEGVLAARE